MSTLFVLVYYVFITTTCDCAKILAVFPTPSISHQIVFRPLVQELAKRGHEVVVITTDPAFQKGKTPQNLIEIDVHNISYRIWNEFVTAEKGQANDAHAQVKYIFELLNKVFEEQLKSEEVQKLIYDKHKKFDLVFFESCVRPALSFSYLYNVPVIEISSLGAIYGTFDTMGVPVQPLLFPIVTRQRIHNLSFREKIFELHNQFSSERTYKLLENSENEMLKRHFGPNIPSLSELRNNVHMLFLNVHPIWDFNRPVSPNILYLGGMHQKPKKELPQDLKSFLDSSKNGVIYMSFGTNVKPSLLPSDKVKIFTTVFSQLPYDILWKWDKDEIPGRSQNVRISKWLPQSDLLKHPKIKLFITQGGLQSTDEALTAGVPLIGVPMLGDQWYNVEKYVIHNIGMKLGIETLTEEILKNAIENVIGNESYRQNVVKLRKIMHDQPQSSLERAVWWTEYILRHGGATHLRSAAANVPWIEYYALDLILLLSIFILSAIIAVALLIYFVVLKLKILRVKLKLN
ncbi:UDP-glucosyltransferase 2-like isoform X1 [Maniola hyperantus]|uniref:UDP-glucosyltransferase 2-like isoform X1 n=1 Tax=Aphantopus hyperantus TaxID=2795564 RepID=UPI001568D134|nr:UDP-glucuronosyltransferase 2B15-like [Maniola hyperantus]